MPPRRKRSILKSLFCLGGGTLNEEPKTPTAPHRLTPSPPSDGRLNAEIPHLSENNIGTYLTMPHSRSTPSSNSQTPLDSPSNSFGQSAPMLGTSPQDSVTQSPQTFFHQAHGFNFEHFEYNNTVKSDNDGWKQLIENTAPNALLTSDARHDPPRCDEDTRVEVTNEIMGWIQDRAAPQSLLCMTGAAGAGKSALQQTVAELCTNLGIFASCFFFSSSDGTRNNVSRITPTIAYQLGLKNPALRRSIATAVEDDPLIFKQTLKIQIERLIVRPISRLPPQDLARFPYAVFIDGLDECAEEDRQRELLAALKACFLNGRTPFRIFLASRPELPIFEALQPGGYLREVAYHIRLSDDYDASADIRRTAQRRLTELGQRRQLERDWYSERDVEAIVEAASGQYIYAATAIRYLSDSRGSPAERLRTIINWAPGKDIKGKGPMAALDLLYTNIVLRAKEGYEAAGTNNQLDFVLILKCYIVIGGYIFHSLRDYDSMLELEYGTHERILCDLRSLITVNDEKDTAAIQRSGALVFYHKSFKDFLRSEIRAGSLFLSENEVHDHLFLCGLRMMAKWPATTFSNAFTENGPITFGGSNTYIRLVKSVSMEAGNRCYGRLNRDHPPSEAVVDAFIVFARDSSGLNKIDNWIVSSEGTSAEQEGNRNDWLAIQDTLLPYVKKKDSVLAATAKEYSMKWKNIKSKHRR